MLNQHFVPVQVDFEQSAKLADRYQAFWTPNLNVIDGREKRVFQFVGWLPPTEFAAMLQTARAHYFLSRKKYDEAAPLFNDTAENFADSSFAPEALYYKGVSRYMASHAVEDLKEDWSALQRRFPDSAWAMRADVI